MSEFRTRIELIGSVASRALLFCAFVFPQAHSQDQTREVLNRLGTGFTDGAATVNGIKLHYVRGGGGPAVILIHGFPQDWSEYAAVMPRLSKHFSVVAMDLRGVGGSSAPAGGYDTASMAEDVYQLSTALKLEHPYVVGHDIGGMVTYAFARLHPVAARGVMILDVPLPGVAGWDDILGDASVWHFHFMQVPGLAEKLVNGRQADYFGYFFSFGKFSPSEIRHFVNSYAAPAQIHAAFEIYRAFPTDAQLNASQHSANAVPLFLGAGERSPFAKLVPKMADDLRANGFAHVTTGSIDGSLHYLVQDQPDAVCALIEHYASAQP